MASEHALLARLEEHFDSALAYHDLYRSRLEAVMEFLPELAEKVRTLSASHQSEIARADTAEARADADEMERDDLKAHIAADEDTAKGTLDVVDAELTAEAAPASISTTSTDPVTTSTASGATVTVDPAADVTTHVDPVAGITTTVDHETGAATAIDTFSSPATPVEPAPAVVAEATAAAAAAGVDVPAQG